MKIVLVDDENITVRWLKKNIESIDPGYEVIGTFQNGVEAFEFIENNDVDVIFTDIRMPLMDGMELLHEIKKQNRVIYIVILSAYDNFSYAREALKLQVNEFILKPEITKEMLKRIFASAESYLQVKTEKNSFVRELLDKQNKYILNILDKNTECSEEVCSSRFSELEIKIKSDNILIINIYIKSKTTGLKIYDIVNFCIQEINIPGMMIVRNEQNYYVIISSKIQEKIREQVEVLLNSLKDFGGTDIMIGVSRIESGYEKLPELYRQTVVALEQLIFYKRPGVLKYGELSEITNKLMYKEVLERYQQKIKGNIEWENEFSREYIDAFLDEMNSEESAPHALIKTMIYDLLNVYRCEIKNSDLQLYELSNIFQIEDYDSLRRFAEKTEQEFLGLLNSCHKKEKYSYTVTKIMDFLETHYNTSISLQDIAEEVHMNRTYISTLFKKETGEGINQYLFKLRIEEAKKLLASSDLPMQQIALKTGFGDGAYFSKMFKKTTGQTPIEYKKSRIKL